MKKYILVLFVLVFSFTFININSAKAVFNFTSTIRLGDQGNEVTELQNFLNTAGYSLVADGFFGAATRAAVIAFQADNHLTTDGIVGPVVRRVLNGGVPPSTGSGAVKITESKNITKILFPDPSCEPSGKNCVKGGNNFLKIIPGDSEPQLIADSWHFTGTPPQTGNDANSVLADLSDPMSPNKLPVSASLNTFDDTYGDFGPYMSLLGVAASKDRSYIFAMQSQGELYGWQNGAKRRLDRVASMQAPIFDVVEYNDNVYLLTGNGAVKVTDLASMPVRKTLPGAIDVGAPVIDTSASTLGNLPASFPQMGVGPKIVMGDGYLASIGTDAKLKVFKLGKSSAIASVDVLNLVLGATATPLQQTQLSWFMENKSFFSQSGPGGQYIFMIVPPYPPTYAEGQSDPSLYYRGYKLYGFKFDGTNLTKVIDGLVLDGKIGFATGIKVGNNVGIVVKLEKYLGLDATGYTKTEKRVRAYLLSSLLSGTIKDELSNSMVTSGVGGFVSDKVSALEKDGVTYLYLGGGGPGVQAPAYVWKLESGTGGSNPPPLPPSPPCPTIAGTVGCVRISPLQARNGETFYIKLLGTDTSIPDATVTRLWIDNGDGTNTFKDFGDWLTVGELKAGNGVQRTLNCKAYESYVPGQATDITKLPSANQILRQKMYLVYGNTGKQSMITAHVKDCRSDTTPPSSNVPWYLQYYLQ